jgi:hypothetical protein
MRQSAGEPQDTGFMETMLAFREMTFGQSEFDPEVYRRAYLDYQVALEAYFAKRSNELLTFPDIADLESHGFESLGTFLELEPPAISFPRSNGHSEQPSQLFMQALEAGMVQSRTGIQVAHC